MRSIKFRAWDGSRMLYSENGDFYLMNNNEVDVPSLTGHEFYRKNYPLMQFTGLTDKNGTEIYEGDILSNQSKDVLMPVVYDDNTASFKMHFHDSPEHINYMSIASSKHIIIIGNIYANPELLTTKPQSNVSEV